MHGNPHQALSFGYGLRWFGIGLECHRFILVQVGLPSLSVRQRMTLAIVIYREHAKRRFQRNIRVAVARFPVIRFAPAIVSHFRNPDFTTRAKVWTFLGGSDYAVHVSSSFLCFHGRLVIKRCLTRRVIQRRGRLTWFSISSAAVDALCVRQKK